MSFYFNPASQHQVREAQHAQPYNIELLTISSISSSWWASVSNSGQLYNASQLVTLGGDRLLSDRRVLELEQNLLVAEYNAAVTSLKTRVDLQSQMMETVRDGQRAGPSCVFHSDSPPPRSLLMVFAPRLSDLGHCIEAVHSGDRNGRSGRLEMTE